MKKTFSISLLFVSFISQAQVTFQKTFGGTAPLSIGYSVEQTVDGGYIIAGSSSVAAIGGMDVYIIKTDSNGDTLWTKSYGTTNDDIAYSVKETLEGGYIITGILNTTSCCDGDLFIMKTNINGDTLWKKTIGIGYSNGYDIIQTMDSGFIAIGTMTSCCVYLVKTNNNGDTLWTKNLYSNIASHFGYSIDNTSDGGFVIAAQAHVNSTYASDVLLVKFNSSGGLLWSKNYGGTRLEGARSVRETTDGGFIIVGRTDSYGASALYDVLLIKTDLSGNLLWTKTYGNAYSDYGYSVEQTNDGGFILAGGWSYSITKKKYLIKTDLNGDTLWTKSFGTGIAFSAKQTSDGGYILTGNEGPNNTLHLIKTDPYGNSNCNDSKPATMVSSPGIIENIPQIQFTNDSLMVSTSPLVIHSGSITTTLCYTDVNDFNTRNPTVTTSPNPFTTETLLEIKDVAPGIKYWNLHMYNVFGQEVYPSIIRSSDSFIVRRVNLSPGIYFFKISNNEKIIVVVKAVIQ
jgi:hypothetical protein